MCDCKENVKVNSGKRKIFECLIMKVLKTIDKKKRCRKERRPDSEGRPEIVEEQKKAFKPVNMIIIIAAGNTMVLKK